MRAHDAGRGAGPVLVHGWGLHAAVWRTLAVQWPPQAAATAFDLAGYGERADESPESLDEAADDLARRTLPGTTACGWSMGALVVLRAARRHPGHFGALVLVGATPRFVAGPGWPHGMSATTFESFARGLRDDAEGTLRRFVALAASGSPEARRLARSLGGALGTPVTPVLEHGLHWLRETDLRDEVAALDTPATVIHGAHDALVPVAAGRWLAARLPRATFIEIPDAGHAPFAGDPPAFARLLEASLG